MKTYDNVYVFGDSFSTPNCCVDIKDSFWYKAAIDANSKTIYNYSHGGNSVESIIHLITSDQKRFNWDGLFLIGIPVLERLTCFDEETKTKTVTIINDNEIREEAVQSHEDFTEYDWAELGKDLLRIENRRWTEARVLRELYLFENWLTHRKKANFMFINLSKKFIMQDQWEPSKKYVKKFRKMDNAIIFSDNTYHNINLGINKPADYNLYGWNGHHGALGNEYFYTNSLKPSLVRSGLL